LRFWSAACSSGQEPYSLAMTLADALGLNADWQILATDISEKVLKKARKGLYPLEEASLIPESKCKSYCLRGNQEYEGWFLIDRVLRERIQFRAINLIKPLPAELNQFDVVLLRNVMIYFEQEHKDRLLAQVHSRLHPGGWLIVGLAETIQPAPPGFKLLKSSVYQRI
jgi:chemotaxis protein methyltransferase CheR